MRVAIAAQVQPQAHSHRTAISRLVLTNFRCYASLRLNITSNCVVLTGPNGAGKTNILEALSLLIPGRGLRKARLGDMGRFEAQSGQWGIAVGVDTPFGRLDIGTALERNDEGGEKRAVKIDGERAATQAQLYENISILWLIPQMEKIFNEGPSARRKFLDRMICGINPHHSKHLYRYEHAMRERSRLLRDRRGDAQWLEALEDTMATQATAITITRQQMVSRLSALSEQSVGSFPKATIDLKGELESWTSEMSALEAEDKLRQSLALSRAKDAENGGASHGPHLSDMHVRHVTKDIPANFCSTGEQKALLITLILANVRLQILERGTSPILLLDEVVAHLDITRRRALFDEIEALGVQTFLTGTDQDTFADLNQKAQFFWVENAKVQEKASFAD